MSNMRSYFQTCLLSQGQIFQTCPVRAGRSGKSVPVRAGRSGKSVPVREGRSGKSIPVREGKSEKTGLTIFLFMQTMSIKRMIFLPQDLGTVWVFSPLGTALGLRPRAIPRGEKTQTVPRSCGRNIPSNSQRGG